MKSFFTKLAAFLVLQLLILIPIAKVSRDNTDHYLAATIDKHARLESLAGERLILVGGSNLAFGIRSDELEAAIGRPVVNMGLQAGLGLSFMLNEVRGSLRAGDVVVICPEYEHFYGDGRAKSPKLLRYLLTQRPASQSFVAAGDLKHVADTAHVIIGDMIRNAEAIALGRADASDPVYHRAGFNAWGDVVAHHGTEAPGFAAKNTAPKIDAYFETEPNPASANILNAFAEYCASAGAKCYISYPAYPAYPAKLTEQNAFIDKLALWMTDAVRIQTLNTPADERRPTEEFYDTEYHLTAQGASLRTGRLTEGLGKLVPREESE